MTAAAQSQPQGLWHRHPWIAYLAVFLGVAGHASSEFVAKVISNETAIAGPEVSVWRFVLGGFGLVVLALLTPGQRDLVKPIRENGHRILPLALLGVTGAYLLHCQANLFNAYQDCRQTHKVGIAVSGNQARQGGLAGARRSPQDHGMRMTRLNGRPQGLARCQ